MAYRTQNIKKQGDSPTMDLPNLDEVVINALNLFAKIPLPKIECPFKRPLVVGSGNAAPTGKIIFSDVDAVFANESSYAEKISNDKNIDGVIVISASGSKHAGGILIEAKRKNLPVRLFTCSKKPPAQTEAGLSNGELYVFPSNVEPYTYNTSTYGGMVFAKTKENPKAVLKYLTDVIAKNIPKEFGKYKGYYLTLPGKYANICDMLRTKFEELFGLSFPYSIYTDEQMKHAKDVIVCPDMLSIELGNVSYHNRFANIVALPLPKDAGVGTVLMIGYYLIGKLQTKRTPVFKKNIRSYCRDTSKTFGKEIDTVVRY